MNQIKEKVAGISNKEVKETYWREKNGLVWIKLSL